MAYTVGSASVDIVPDFRRAQIEITKFFNSQPDKFTIHAKVDVDENSARSAGTRMGKAMEDGAKVSRTAGDRDAIRDAKVREQAITRAHGEALRMQADMDRAAAREKQRLMREIEREAAAQYRERQRAIDTERQYAIESARATFRAMQQVFDEREKMRVQIEIDKQNAIMEARTTGGLIARSIHHELRQNAGLVAAALGAVLIAGAPVALAAATTLFGAIGAAGAAQNQELRSSWRGLWNEIKDGAVSDAAVLVPAFDRMAGSIGQSFQRMRPQVRDAFDDLGPQIDTFTDSVTKAAENALPGLVRAVREGGPVVSGFGELLEDTGTGLTNFFDRTIEHGPAAGRVFRELGGTMEVLLPLLGEVLGQGAELATVVLPAFNTALSGSLAVVDTFGGALPLIGAGFLSFRLATGAGRLVNKWSQSLALASLEGGRFSAAQGRAAGALHNVGRAMPVVGAGLALVGAAMAESEMQTQQWTDALNTGGAAAAKARQEMAEFKSAIDTMTTGFVGLLGDVTGMGAMFDIYANDVEDAEQAHQDFLDSLTPLERAQRTLDIATKALADAMDDESTSAAELARLQADVARASARTAEEQEKLEMATKGVTEAMAEQADAARARVDTEFGYQKALLDVEQSLIDAADAQKALDEARADGDPAGIKQAELDLREALLGVNEAYADQLTAANARATSNLPAALNDEQKKILGYKAELDELNTLIEQGVVLPESMMQYRDFLIGMVEEADGAALAQAQIAAALGEVGLAAEAIPGEKAIRITSPTSDEVKQKLSDLGFTVETMKDGTVKVTAETDEAKANVGNLSALLTGLDQKETSPEVGLDDAVFHDRTRTDFNLLDLLGGKTANPKAGLLDTVFTAVNNSVNNRLAALNGTTANPRAGLLDGVFSAVNNSVVSRLGTLNRTTASPTVTVRDFASGPLVNIQSKLANLRDRTLTVTTRNVTVAGSNTRATVGMARGGAIEDAPLQLVQKFAGGGAIVGRGSARDDLVPFAGPDPNVSYRAANGEHLLDGLDVALMGGQTGVYAFREALKSGKIGGPGADNGIQQMSLTGQMGQMPQMPAGTRDVTILTQDNPRAIIRAMKAEEQQQAALARVW